MTVTNEDIENKADTLSPRKQQEIYDIFEKIKKAELANGFENCLKLIGEEYGNPSILDGSDIYSTYTNGSHETYVKAGNKAYRLYIEDTDYEYIHDTIMYNDICKLNFISDAG
jgi:hypothetical protein